MSQKSIIPGTDIPHPIRFWLWIHVNTITFTGKHLYVPHLFLDAQDHRTMFDIGHSTFQAWDYSQLLVSIFSMSWCVSVFDDFVKDINTRLGGRLVWCKLFFRRIAMDVARPPRKVLGKPNMDICGGICQWNMVELANKWTSPNYELAEVNCCSISKGQSLRKPFWSCERDGFGPLRSVISANDTTVHNQRIQSTVTFCKPIYKDPYVRK